MNWKVWWAWAVQHNARGLGLVFITIGVAPYVILPIIGRRMHAGARFLRKCKIDGWLLLQCTAIYILGDFTEHWFEIIANIDPPRGMANGAIAFPSWFTWWLWIGRTIKLASVLLYAWGVLLHERDDKEEMKDAARRREET